MPSDTAEHVSTHHSMIACHECDLLIRMSDSIPDSDALYCPRCKHKIAVGTKNPIEKVIALSITCFMVLGIANSFPFLSFETQGQKRTITLIDAAAEMFVLEFYGLAVLIFVCVLAIPILYLSLILSITLPIKLKLPQKPAIIRGRIVSCLLPWSMSEVFLVGVLVALIKIFSMAEIIFGLSFWAYVVFTMLFTYISTLVDHHRLWHWVQGNETLSTQRKI